MTQRGLLRNAAKRLQEARSQSPDVVRKSSSRSSKNASWFGSLMPARHVQLSLLFGSRLVQSIMRMAMGPLLVSICDDLECSAASKGQLLSGFSLGYLSSQVVGGAMADRIGAKAMVLLSTVLGALLTVGCGFATSTVGQLWLAQVLLGVSQGPLFPTSIAFLSSWVPPEERAFASTVLDTGITVGSLVALPCSGLLAAAYGWRATLAVYGVFGLVFAVVWFALACPSPAACPYITDRELSYLNKAIKHDTASPASKSLSKSAGSKVVVSSPAQGAVLSRPRRKSSSSSGGGGGNDDGDGEGDKKKRAPSKREGLPLFLGHPSVWAIFVSHMAFNFGVYFLTSWTPTYYKDVLGVRPEAAGLAFSVPPACNCLVKLLISTPLETFLRKRRGFSTLHCRRFFSCVGFAGASAGLLLVTPLTAAWGVHGATLGFALALSAAALHPAGFKANYMDVSRNSGGLVSGVGNTLASVASFVSPLAVGFILNANPGTLGWGVVFGAIAGANALAAALFGTLSTATPID